jgi:DNA-binding LytR/AlgR family response regulator
MNCIIICHKENLTLLEGYVNKLSSLVLKGKFTDLESAKTYLPKQQDIDLLLLDLDLMGTDIVDSVKQLINHPNVIMISSSEEDALRAFDFEVVDFLLKPVSIPRFCRAVDKAFKYYSKKPVAGTGNNEIFIKRGSLLVKLKIKDIEYIEALENYVTLYAKDERFTIHFTMKGIATQLPSEIFTRIHRSFIVNKNLIHAIRESTLDLLSGNTLKNLPVGKSFRDSLLNEIRLISR